MSLESPRGKTRVGPCRPELQGGGLLRSLRGWQAVAALLPTRGRSFTARCRNGGSREGTHYNFTDLSSSSVPSMSPFRRDAQVAIAGPSWTVARQASTFVMDRSSRWA